MKKHGFNRFNSFPELCVSFPTKHVESCINFLTTIWIPWRFYNMSGYYFSTQKINTTMLEFYFICHFLHLCFHSLSGIWTYKVGMTEAAIRKHAPTPLPNSWGCDSQTCPPSPSANLLYYIKYSFINRCYTFSRSTK